MLCFAVSFVVSQLCAQHVSFSWLRLQVSSSHYGRCEKGRWAVLHLHAHLTAHLCQAGAPKAQQIFWLPVSSTFLSFYYHRLTFRCRNFIGNNGECRRFMQFAIWPTPKPCMNELFNLLVSNALALIVLVSFLFL